MPGPESTRAFTEAGRRNTRQRDAVREYLDGLTRFNSAQQVHDGMRESGHKIGLATVYRTLQAMADAGEVDTLQVDEGTLYRKCGERHHHHLVCRECGRAVEVTGTAVERWASKSGREHGYAEVSHVVELFGVCPECSGD